MIITAMAWVSQNPKISLISCAALIILLLLALYRVERNKRKAAQLKVKNLKEEAARNAKVKGKSDALSDKYSTLLH